VAASSHGARFGVEGFALPGADDFVFGVGKNEVAVNAVDHVFFIICRRKYMLTPSVLRTSPPKWGERVRNFFNDSVAGKPIICMQKADDVSGGEAEAFVEGIVNTVVGFGDELGYPVGSSFDNFQCIIGGGAIDDDVFDVFWDSLMSCAVSRCLWSVRGVSAAVETRQYLYNFSFFIDLIKKSMWKLFDI
jgi:hypothetical protein